MSSSSKAKGNERIVIPGMAEAASKFVELGRDYMAHILALDCSPLMHESFESVARIVGEACDQLEDVPALVEAVEAARGQGSVVHLPEHDTDPDSVADFTGRCIPDCPGCRLDAALARFDFGDPDAP